MNKPKTGAKILYIDIETLPNVGFCWGKYEQNILSYERESCLATVAYKWEGGRVQCLALPDYKGYVAGSYDDKALVKDVWALMDEADIVVAHNGIRFDVKKLNARFIRYKMDPPSPFKTIDTKVIAKRVAMFNSNKLDDLGNHFGLGRKIKTDFDLWLGCIRGDKKSWARMVSYNKQDVLLLEKVYKRLMAWAPNHPNTGTTRCPRCGGEPEWRGWMYTTTRRYRRFRCKSCGGWGKDSTSERYTALVVQ